MEKCYLNEQVHVKSWLLYLATRTKRIFHHWLRACVLKLNGMPTSAHLNVLPLSSYSMIFAMDWLFIHRIKVDCYDMDIEFSDNDGERRFLQGKKKLTSMSIYAGKAQSSEGMCIVCNAYF